MTTCPPPSIADAVCPLCGQSNQCAIASGQAAADCWCMTVSISPSALSAVLPGDRGQRCICPGCARIPEDRQEDSSAHTGSAL